jgi:hypothetical protein
MCLSNSTLRRYNTTQKIETNFSNYSAWWGLYKLNPVDPQLESARFQPLSL